jgi:hypothetical protein
MSEEQNVEQSQQPQQQSPSSIPIARPPQPVAVEYKGYENPQTPMEASIELSGIEVAIAELTKRKHMTLQNVQYNKALMIQEKREGQLNAAGQSEAGS